MLKICSSQVHCMIDNEYGLNATWFSINETTTDMVQEYSDTPTHALNHEWQLGIWTIIQTSHRLQLLKRTMFTPALACEVCPQSLRKHMPHICTTNSLTILLQMCHKYGSFQRDVQYMIVFCFCFFAKQANGYTLVVGKLILHIDLPRAPWDLALHLHWH